MLELLKFSDLEEGPHRGETQISEEEVLSGWSKCCSVWRSPPGLENRLPRREPRLAGASVFGLCMRSMKRVVYRCWTYFKLGSAAVVEKTC